MSEETITDEIRDSSVSLGSLGDNTFDQTKKVHDWRNYVPDLIKENWEQLSFRERMFVALTATIPAKNETWE